MLSFGKKKNQQQQEVLSEREQTKARIRTFYQNHRGAVSSATSIPRDAELDAVTWQNFLYHKGDLTDEQLVRVVPFTYANMRYSPSRGKIVADPHYIAPKSFEQRAAERAARTPAQKAAEAAALQRRNAAEIIRKEREADLARMDARGERTPKPLASNLGPSNHRPPTTAEMNAWQKDSSLRPVTPKEREVD